jgi:uncharacterized membrane-anchored protein YitT (DUF2179 family)
LDESALLLLSLGIDMITLLAPDFKPLVVTESDLAIASITWGFTLGFGFLTTFNFSHSSDIT